MSDEVRMTITDSSDPTVTGTSWTTDEDGAHHTAQELTFARLATVNRSRKQRWHVDGSEPWTGADWALAMGGEAGEAQNVVKKLRRLDTGVVLGIYDAPRPDLLAKLGEELADVIIYLDLLAAFYDIDLPAAVVAKFNKKSIEQGFPERLP